jgi:uncharacterized protein YndB with AHSA1/START domain
MARNYTVSTKIARPVAEVFNAVVAKDRLCRYFVDGTTADLGEGERVVWHWNEWGDFPVIVRRVVPNELIVLEIDSREWKKTRKESYAVRVIIEFDKLDDNSTMVSISEEGWKIDPDGLKASHDNCGGWQHMAMCLKAYIEHGIDLR